MLRMLRRHLCTLLCCITSVQSQTSKFPGKEDNFVLEKRTSDAFSCHLGPTRCPDGGEYSNAGGNVTLTILSMRNLPDHDSFGAFGLESDAFIRVTVGEDVRESGAIDNSLNPDWPACEERYCTGDNDIVRDLNFGNRRAGRRMIVEIWDEDSGLEFTDDNMGRFSVFVIYCSAYTAKVQATPHEDLDGHWQMPEQPVCVEEAWINLTNQDQPCSETDRCVKLRQTVIPFQMNVEQVYLPDVVVNGGMAGFYEESMPRSYGRVYSGSDDRLMNYNRFQAHGGMLVRSDSTTNNEYGNQTLADEMGLEFPPYARFTFNFDAEMYVFRRVSDMDWQPEWLDEKYGWENSTDYAQLQGVQGDFGAVRQSIKAHSRNRYGDSLGAGVITGMNIHQENNDFTSQMYFIVLVAVESSDQLPEVYSKKLEVKNFLYSTAQFGILFLLFFSMFIHYLHRMHWRVDRIEPYLLQFADDDIDEVSLMKGGEELDVHILKKPKNVLRTLFLCYNDSSHNHDFRENLFYAKCCIRIYFFLPFLLLFTWGVTTVSTVSPPSVGIMLVFIGYVAIAMGYAIWRWKSTGWRMTRAIMMLFSTALFSCFLFLLSSTFVDPNVYKGGDKVDFFSLSAVFLTLNMMPMIWLAFTNDSKIMKSLEQVLAIVTASKKSDWLKRKFKGTGVLGLKLGMAKGEAMRKEAEGKIKERPKSKFDVLLGDYYSIESSIPGFELADILKNPFVIPPLKQKKISRMCYGFAISTLLVFSLLSVFATDFPLQGFGITFTIIMTDLSMAMLLRGNISWSAGYIVFLMSSSRVALVVTGGTYWLLGQSLLFLILGIALCREIVQKQLPRMSKTEAGGIAFFGHDAAKVTVFDISTTPEFVLGFLSFFFIFLLLAVVFGTGENPDDIVLLPMFGQEWAMWVFGLLSFVLVLFFGVLLGTSRAFFLLKEQLLSKYASTAYLFHKAMKIPYILAAASELLVFCAGLFLFASTGSSFIFLVCIFVPIIMMLGLVVFAQWHKNDYVLVIWPPAEEEEQDDDDDDSEFDEEAEYEKGAAALRDDFVLPSTKTGDGPSTFKMPTLPLKGALSLGKSLLPGKKSILQLAGKKSDKKLNEEDEEEESSSRKKEKEQEDDEDDDEERSEKEDDEDEPDQKLVVVKNTGSLSSSKSNKVNAFLQKAKSLAKYSFKKKEMTSIDGELKEEEEVDFNTMSLYTAFWEQYLLPEDYITIGALAALLFVVFIFGLLISFTEKPSWFGHLIYVGFFYALFTISPIVKWFNTLEFTSDMRYSAIFTQLLAWITGFIIFFATLKGDVNDVNSLIVLSFLILYPILILMIVTILKWRDDGWLLSDFVRISIPLCLFFIVIWVFEMYVWVSLAVGGLLTFILFALLCMLFFLTKWIENEFYVAPHHQRFARIGLGCGMFSFVALGIIASEIFYGFSIALTIGILKLVCNIIGTRMTREPDVQLFYSPFIFPIYSYDAKTNSVVNENYEMTCLYQLYGLSFLWGVLAIMFADPLAFGVGLCSLVLVCVAGTSAHLCSITPVQMGIAAKYVNETMLHDAAASSKKGFDARREELQLECAEYIEIEARKREEELTIQAMAMGTKVSPKSLNVFNIHAADAVEDPERHCSADLAMRIEDAFWKCNTTHFEDDEIRRVDSFFTSTDAIMEIWRRGHGPLGFLSLFGGPYWLWCKMGNLNKNVLYDTNGAFLSENTEDDTLIDSMRYMKSISALDAELDGEFYEETRCIIHFQLLVLHAAEARLSREKVTFPKFLQDKRFQLLSMGIKLPSAIFKTNSFASIDIPLVAVWLMSLTVEERERFNTLKSDFSKEIMNRDEMIDEQDKNSRVEQEEHVSFLKQREDVMGRRKFQEVNARRLRRQEEDVEIGDQDEDVVNAQENIAEIESGWECIVGSYGRSLQFVDPDFLPDESSLGDCIRKNEIVSWKVSTEININAGLFDGGTDPDDVHVGKLNDSWLLSAISILAADGVDDGKVDPLVDNLFITKQTSLTGAYAMRLYKNSQWETVITDDHFPCLDDRHKTETHAGAAFGHSKNFEEIWVPLLEKAYAKYHGGYASLEHGYVHHALKDLSGAESIQIYLAQASRGARKKKLWTQLLEYQKNKFKMGAGTISSDNADHEILDTGLVFGQCYVIYDIRKVDGVSLVKLRNPPGDHAEWRGDWGDESALWTRRLKVKLGWTDADDNTFWMSFDDFCNAFQCLYVCQYYDPVRWVTHTFNGTWSTENATSGGIPTHHNPNCVVENNAQYILDILRPSDVVITVTQVDETGLAVSQVQPFAIYVVKCKATDRTVRVKELNRDNVIAHSGVPERKREMKLHCTLPARTYTVLVAPYMCGLEGPFKIEIQSNFKIVFEQQWPPPWREVKEPNTLAEKMAHKLKEGLKESSALGKISVGAATSKLRVAAAEAGAYLKDGEEIIQEEINKEAGIVTKPDGSIKKKSPWKEQWDEETGKPFYENRKTGISQWDKPDDF